MEFGRIYQELTQSTEMIRALLAGVSGEEARVKPNPDSWSILEVTYHLHDEEREDFREHLDFILNRRDKAWHVIDPQGWVTERKYNEQDFMEMWGRFFAEREKSLQWLKGLSSADWGATYTSEYGSTSAGEMLACWAAHDNLHIRQLVELRRNLIERLTKPHEIQYAGDW